MLGPIIRAWKKRTQIDSTLLDRNAAKERQASGAGARRGDGPPDPVEAENPFLIGQAATPHAH